MPPAATRLIILNLALLRFRIAEILRLVIAGVIAGNLDTIFYQKIVLLCPWHSLIFAAAVLENLGELDGPEYKHKDVHP